MRPVLRFSILLLFAAAACKKGGGDTVCTPAPAGTQLRFRFIGAMGYDQLYTAALIKDSLRAYQPCNMDSLKSVFTTYPLSGGQDSGVVLRFSNLRTPVYGEGGDCFRIFFRWSRTDVDTLDWHYRMEQQDGCTVQQIDYITYNGVPAIVQSDNSGSYYRLLK